MLTYGRRIPLTEFDYRIQQVDAKTIREVCTRYLYDKCPVIVGIGTSVLCSQVHVLCIYDDFFGQESVSLSSVSDCVCVHVHMDMYMNAGYLTLIFLVATRLTCFHFLPDVCRSH